MPHVAAIEDGTAGLAVRLPEPFTASHRGTRIQLTGVLAEPFSVAEKAISEAVHLQLTRLPDMATSLDWLSGKRCLVAGLGPIGLLAALSLRMRNADVSGLDVVDADTARPRWLNVIGGHYVDGRQVTPLPPVSDAGTFGLWIAALAVNRYLPWHVRAVLSDGTIRDS